MSAAPRLPELIDHAGIRRELNVKRATADAIMARCRKVIIPGVNKVHVYRADVDAVIADATVDVRVKTPLRSVA